jgi:uncharacterized protein
MATNRMSIEVTVQVDHDVTCANCEACCCRLEVMLLTETGVPDRFIQTDKWGGLSMARLDDGWCSALDRNSMKCTIYTKRPLVCREYVMGGYECIDERTAYKQGH